MKIRLRNEIHLDEQMEVVDQTYPVEVMIKTDSFISSLSMMNKKRPSSNVTTWSWS